jgi:hypothetical protein
MTTFDISPYRAAVLAKISILGATRESPIRLQGAEFRAALWLFEHDLVGKVGSEFYAIEVPEQTP